MSVWLEARGVDPSRIIVEDKATSTMENLEPLPSSSSASPAASRDGNVAIVTSSTTSAAPSSWRRGGSGVEAWGVAGHTTWPTLMLTTSSARPSPSHTTGFWSLIWKKVNVYDFDKPYCLTTHGGFFRHWGAIPGPYTRRWARSPGRRRLRGWPQRPGRRSLFSPLLTCVPD